MKIQRHYKRVFSITANNRNGFIAMTSLLIIAFSTIAIALAIYNSVIAYADSINLKEIRMQVDNNLTSCMDLIPSILIRDYYIEGEEYIPDLGCTLDFDYSHGSDIHIRAEMKYRNLNIYREKTI